MLILHHKTQGLAIQRRKMWDDSLLYLSNTPWLTADVTIMKLPLKALSHFHAWESLPSGVGLQSLLLPLHSHFIGTGQQVRE